MEPAAHTSALRLAAFVPTALGGVLVGLGAVLSWATVSVGSDPGISLDTRGTDGLEGKLVLGLAVAILVAFLLLTVVSPPTRRVLGALIVVATLAAGGLVLSVLSDLDGTVGLGAVERETAELAAELGVPGEAFARELARLTTTERGPGLLVSLAGSAIALVGGILTLRWVARDPTGEGTARTPLDELEPDRESEPG